MSSLARIGDDLSAKPRLKTFLNGSQTISLAFPGVEISLSVDSEGNPEAPSRVMLLPANQRYKVDVYDFKNNKFVTLDVESSPDWIAKVVANTIQVWGENPVPVFISHSRYGESYGWIRPDNLELDDQGLWCNGVKWTDDTRRLIAQGKFRYVSPSIPLEFFDPVTKKVIGPVLDECSLTNIPYFRRQEGLAASDNLSIAAAVPVAAISEEENNMDLSKISELLGLKADATEDDVAEEVKRLHELESDLGDLTAVLDLDEGQTAEAKIAKLVAAAAEPADEEPEAEKEVDQTFLSDTAAGMNAAAAELMVDAAIEAKKLPPKSKPRWVKGLTGRTVAEARDMLADLHAQIPTTDSPDNAGYKKPSRCAARFVCNQFQLTVLRPTASATGGKQCILSAIPVPDGIRGKSPC